jgi:hypothetical protein
MPDNPLKIFEDRSGLLDYAACPRLRFWSREWGRGQLFTAGPKEFETIPPDAQPEDMTGMVVRQDAKVHCGGLQPLKKSVYLVLGGAVHTGLNRMMLWVKEWEEHGADVNANLLGDPVGWRELVLEATDHALAEFDLQTSSDTISVPDAKTPEQVAWKLREARALVEGLVMVAGFRLVPNLVERFRVVEVEREKRFKLAEWPIGTYPDGTPIPNSPTQEVWFESRADALLEERATGDLYVHSWKTSGDYGRQEEEQFKRDVQGLSEAIAIEETGLPGDCCQCGDSIDHDAWGTGHTPVPVMEQVKIQGIQMAFLLKGRKYPADRLGLGEGLKIHYSPITRAWRQFAHGILPEQDESTWAWSWDVPKVNQKTGAEYIGNLGKGWEPQVVFDDYPGGTRQWILDLLDGKWQPEVGDPFRMVVAMPEPWSRSDREMEDWKAEAQSIVEQIHPRAEEVRQAMAQEDWQRARKLLNRYFPKDRASCFRYGGRCWAEGICFGPDDVGQRPLENGFALREPHHSLGGEE